MVSVSLGIPSHDVLPGVSTSDHHVATVAADLNFAALADVLAAGDATAAELETLTDGSSGDSLHVHPLLASKVATATRTAAAASGDVVYSGAGFRPRAVIVMGFNSDDKDAFSIGFGDVDALEDHMRAFALGGTPDITTGGQLVALFDSTDTHGQRATLKTLDADGMTLAWVKVMDGRAVTFDILWLR